MNEQNRKCCPNHDESQNVSGTEGCIKESLEQSEDFIEVREQIIELVESVGENWNTCAQKYLLRTVVEKYMRPVEEILERMKSVSRVMGFEVDSDGGVKQVGTDSMPDGIREMIEKLTGAKIDDTDDDDDSEPEENENADSMIDLLMKSFIARQMMEKTASSIPGQLEARLSSSEDLKYFELYIKEWTKRLVERRVTKECRALNKSIEKNILADWKESLKLMRKTNSKVRGDLREEIEDAINDLRNELLEQSADEEGGKKIQLIHEKH